MQFWLWKKSLIGCFQYKPTTGRPAHFPILHCDSAIIALQCWRNYRDWPEDKTIWIGSDSWAALNAISKLAQSLTYWRRWLTFRCTNTGLYYMWMPKNYHTLIDCEKWQVILGSIKTHTLWWWSKEQLCLRRIQLWSWSQVTEI